jgi:hypothetical protein
VTSTDGDYKKNGTSVATAACIESDAGYHDRVALNEVLSLRPGSTNDDLPEPPPLDPRAPRIVKVPSPAPALPECLEITKAHTLSQLQPSLASTSTPPPELRLAQQLAITALLAGASEAKAARTAGVARETVNRWRHTDPSFIAWMNYARACLWVQQREALRSLIPKAVRAVADGLEDEDPRVRLQAAALLLKTAGIGAEGLGPPSTSTHPRDEIGACRKLVWEEKWQWEETEMLVEERRAATKRAHAAQQTILGPTGK